MRAEVPGARRRRPPGGGGRAVPARGTLVALALALALSAPGPARAAPPDGTTAPPRTATIPTSVSDTARLTLARAVRAALATYPSVGAAKATAASRRAAVGRAVSGRWPDLSLRASAHQYQEPVVVRPIHGFTPGTAPPFDETLLEAGLYLDYTLWDFGAREARVRSGRQAASAAGAARTAAAQGVVADVADAYLAALGLRRVVAAHDRRIDALRSERERVRQLREVGRAARVELLRVEAALAGARSDREGVRAELRVVAGELARLTGLRAEAVRPGGLADAAWTGPGLPALDELTGRAVAHSPAVERARRQRAAAGAGHDVARAARWPELRLGGAWVDRGSDDGDFRAEWNVGVCLAVPLFTGGRVEAGVQEARAEEEAAVQRVRLAETAVARAVDRARASVVETTSRVESLERAAESQAEVARIEKLRLETGTGTQTDYLDAEAELLTVRASLARTRYAALRARVELARATGELDAPWIEENLEERR